MHELTNTVLSAEDAFGPGARGLVERLREGNSWGERFQLIDRFIQARLLAAEGRPEAMVWAYGVLRGTAGGASIGSLAAELGYSKKRLIAQFRENLGLPPKTLARVMRFERAVRMVQRDGEATDWVRLAAECGYYDQAHLIREFREFAGMTPGEFVGRLTADYGNIVEPSAER
jgi:AraC-like DNA-binding protein